MVQSDPRTHDLRNDPCGMGAQGVLIDESAGDPRVISGGEGHVTKHPKAHYEKEKLKDKARFAKEEGKEKIYEEKAKHGHHGQHGHHPV
jgi:hypothetical protein